MTSLGNDIVALSAINAERTKRESFYKKILAPSEINNFQQQLHEKISFENYLWLLWTVKESTFKCLQRHSPDLIFSPRNIIVEQVDLKLDQPVSTLLIINHHWNGSDNYANCKCIITVEGKTLYSHSFITEQWIYTIVCDQDSFSDIQWGIQEIAGADYETQHSGIRNFALEKLITDPALANPTFIKTEIGFPAILNNGILQDTILSFTHHENLVAYAFK